LKTALSGEFVVTAGNFHPDGLYPAHHQCISERTQQALQACGLDSLVIASGTQRLVFLDDHHLPFKANPHWLWWLPLLHAPDCLLHIRPGLRPRVLFCSAEDYWHLPAQIPQESWAQHFDIEPVSSPQAAWAALGPLDPRTGFVGEVCPAEQASRFAAINTSTLLAHLHDLRVRKTPYEIGCLRAASAIGVRGHQAAHQAYVAGGSEFDIHQAFLQGCGQREQELPYQAIVGLNEHAATLHYQQLDRHSPPQHRSLLIDAGAGFRGYGSDITRTYGSGHATFEALVHGMDALQQTLCAAVRSGLDWRELHLQAHLHIAELLAAHDIIKADPQHAVECGLSAVFLPHGLGHLLGLQVHDVAGFQPSPTTPAIAPPPGHPTLRLTRRLEPGFVVTVEPGLYFIDLLLQRARNGAQAAQINWPLVDALRPWGGIRIEDNVLVTETGRQNLTREAFANELSAATSG
jgi:Xaa-Pro dipeptidase